MHIADAMRDLKQDIITIHNRKYLIFVVTLKQRKWRDRPHVFFETFIIRIHMKFSSDHEDMPRLLFKLNTINLAS